MTISTLIDKHDTAEIVRDQIAAILAIESATQVTLATTAAKPSPNDWKLRVYQERADLWEGIPGENDDRSAVVNVRWDTSMFDANASNIVERQKSSTTITIDCYGYGKSRDAGAAGHVCGDQAAAEAAQRATRLVRNILMSAEYVYLGLRGVVWRRWVESITMMPPQQDNNNVYHVVAARVAIRVEFNEYSPQFVPQPLELLTADVIRADDGQVVIDADYDYTV